jgi:hypothetical protein
MLLFPVVVQGESVTALLDDRLPRPRTGLIAGIGADVFDTLGTAVHEAWIAVVRPGDPNHAGLRAGSASRRAPGP